MLQPFFKFLSFFSYLQISTKSCVELTSVDPQQACLGGNSAAFVMGHLQVK